MPAISNQEAQQYGVGAAPEGREWLRLGGELALYDKKRKQVIYRKQIDGEAEAPPEPKRQPVSAPIAAAAAPPESRRPPVETPPDAVLDAAPEGDSLQTILGPDATAADKLQATQKLIDELTNFKHGMLNIDLNSARQFIGPEPDDSLRPFFVDPDAPGGPAAGTPPGGVTDSAEFPPEGVTASVRGDDRRPPGGVDAVTRADDPSSIESATDIGGLPAHFLRKKDTEYKPTEGGPSAHVLRKEEAQDPADTGTYFPESGDVEIGPSSQFRKGRDITAIKGIDQAPEAAKVEDAPPVEAAPVASSTREQDAPPGEKFDFPLGEPRPGAAFDRLRGASAARRAAREETESQQEPPPEKRYRKGLGGGATAHAHRRQRGQQPERFKRPDFKPVVSSARKLLGRLGRAIQRDPGGVTHDVMPLGEMPSKEDVRARNLGRNRREYEQGGRVDLEALRKRVKERGTLRR